MKTSRISRNGGTKTWGQDSGTEGCMARLGSYGEHLECWAKEPVGSS